MSLGLGRDLPCAAALEISRRVDHDFFLFVGRLFILVPSIVDHRGALVDHPAVPIGLAPSAPAAAADGDAWDGRASEPVAAVAASAAA